MKCGHLLLRDTRGNFYLGIRLPTREYRPRPDRRQQYQREYYLRNKERHNINSRKWAANNREKSRQIKKNWRDKNPQYHTDYSREWKKHLPFEKWQYYRNQKREYMKSYYQKNKDKILHIKSGIIERSELVYIRNDKTFCISYEHKTT